MFGNETELPQCADVSVDTHLYNVHGTFVDDGSTMFNVSIYAGSIAHAAMLTGMTPCALIVREAESVETADQIMHNITNHVNVAVTLAV